MEFIPTTSLNSSIIHQRNRRKQPKENILFLFVQKKITKLNFTLAFVYYVSLKCDRVNIVWEQTAPR